MAQHDDNVSGKRASAPPEVMIFGSGACARKIALNLTDRGVDVCLAAETGAPLGSPAESAASCLFDADLDYCRGFAGNFELQLRHRQGVVRKTVPVIVVAEDPSHSPNHAAYGLTPGPWVMDISLLEQRLGRHGVDSPIQGPATVAFLCGWQNDAQPCISMRMLDACCQLQNRTGISTFFMAGNLKVAAEGAEKRVEAAKRSGALFLKFTDQYPAIVPVADNRFRIDYIDELIGTPFRLDTDWIIVDETIGPARHLAALTEKLGIDQDGVGFAQADNVHRMSNATNRRGIFVAGGGRGLLSIDEQLADADQVSLAVTAFLQGIDIEPLPPAIVQRERCARCLTCHRLCPHLAVEIGAHISIVAEACQRCGLCMAGCPACAIQMEGVPIDADISQRVVQSALEADHPVSVPQIMVFGCARSAGQAVALTRLMGKTLPAGVHFVEVPCGGAIADRHLLAAFEGGADGVLLCICHNDNCRSQNGNRIACKRAAAVQELLKSAGLKHQRLRVATVAANMGNALAAWIEAFASEIAVLGGT